MEGGIGRMQLAGAKWCSGSLAPGPCFPYFWIGARLDGMRVMQSGAAPREAFMTALSFCSQFGTCTAAHLGCVNGAVDASTHPLVPQTPECTLERLNAYAGESFPRRERMA